MSKIHNGLYLGDMNSAFDHNFLRRKGIKAVISFCIPMEYQWYSQLTKKPYIQLSDISYTNFPIMDDSSEIISYRFRNVCDLIDMFLKAKHPVLIHCYMGVSRSSSFMISYLMRKYKVSYDKAYQFVKQRRPIINPNPGFILQLKEYEKLLSYSV